MIVPPVRAERGHGANDAQRTMGIITLRAQPGFAVWLLTLPAAAVVGALAGKVADLGTGGVVTVAIAGGRYTLL